MISDPAVREAWTRYYTVLNDPALNVGAGFALREEKRRELLLETTPRQQMGRTPPQVARASRAYPIPSALETDRLAEAGGFERLHLRIGIAETLSSGREDSNIRISIGRSELINDGTHRCYSI